MPGNAVAHWLAAAKPKDVSVLHEFRLFDAVYRLVMMPDYGPTLAREVTGDYRQLAFELVQLGSRLADANLAHNDLRPANLVRVPGEGLGAIDFDRCCPLNWPQLPDRIVNCAEVPRILGPAPLLLHQTCLCLMRLNPKHIPVPDMGGARYLITREYLGDLSQELKEALAPVWDIIVGLVPEGYHCFDDATVQHRLHQILSSV
eukprot:GAFH01002597.1.p1 GENE.GAFH01002597.1~~GAFH01002597.1.p1  ORF type:complete len:203 (-),score=19.32 GAFH01002597.1:362-970(-)